MIHYYEHAHRASDDAELRRMLTDHPLRGRIAISFEREPSFFIASDLEGPITHTTSVVREVDSQRIAAMGTRSVRMRYLDGEPTPVGYLSQLRNASSTKTGYALLKVFERLRLLHEDAVTKLYLMSVDVTNATALRFLQSGRKSLPRVREYCSQQTLILPVSQRGGNHSKEKLAIRSGSSEDKQQIINQVEDSYGGLQFAPVWSHPGQQGSFGHDSLSAEDFQLVFEGGELAACAALWDQSSFKQNRILDYGPGLATIRPLINLLTGLHSYPKLPAAGKMFRMGFVSHLAVDRKRSDHFEALVDQLLKTARERDLHTLVLSLCEGDPFIELVRSRYRCLIQHNIIFLVGFQEEWEYINSISKRLTYLEGALL